MTDTQKKALTITGIVAFVLLMAAVTWFVGRPLLSFASEPELFRDWVDGYGLRGKLLFTGIIILQTIVAFIPGEPFEIVAGYAFGAFMGTFLCVLGEVIGSVSVFLFVRRFGRKAIEVFFSSEKIDSLRFLKNEKKLGAFVFFVFLIPGTPKDVLCYCVGLTKMKLSTWLLISSVARFPSVVSSTIGGDALGLGNTAFAFVVFGVTVVLSVSGMLMYNRIVKRREAKMKQDESRAQSRAAKREAKRARKAEKQRVRALAPRKKYGKKRAK